MSVGAEKKANRPRAKLYIAVDDHHAGPPLYHLDPPAPSHPSPSTRSPCGNHRQQGVQESRDSTVPFFHSEALQIVVCSAQSRRRWLIAAPALRFTLQHKCHLRLRSPSGLCKAQRHTISGTLLPYRGSGSEVVLLAPPSLPVIVQSYSSIIRTAHR
jgi:hypothetical protein